MEAKLEAMEAEVPLEESKKLGDFNATESSSSIFTLAAASEAAEAEKVRVEYMESSGENIVHIVDFGNNFSTAIVASSEAGGLDDRGGIITVISESQLQENGGTTYEYIPLNHDPNAGGQVRDALQAALESAEVDKMDLLRSDGTAIIFENSDSNSQPQHQVIWMHFSEFSMYFDEFWMYLDTFWMYFETFWMYFETFWMYFETCSVCI